MFGLFGKRARHLSMREAQAELEKDRSIVLVDVRTPEEYKEGHISNSINVPLDSLPRLAGQKIKDKNARLFVYCLSGSRSSAASSWLMGNGYENVTNIGGIMSWGGPVVR